MHRQGGRLVGVGLLVVLILMLLIAPRLLRGGEHPLAQTASFDLCSRLGSDVWSLLDAKPMHMDASRDGTDAGPECVADLSQPAGSGEPPPQVLVVMVSQALLHRQGGTRANTKRYVETFIAETRASGWTVETLQGPWKDGYLMTQANLPSQQQFLAEDDGVVITINASRTRRDALVAFAGAVARRLREPASE